MIPPLDISVPVFPWDDVLALGLFFFMLKSAKPAAVAADALADEGAAADPTAPLLVVAFVLSLPLDPVDGEQLRLAELL